LGLYLLQEVWQLKIVAKAAAEYLTPVTLEWRNPCIDDETADIALSTSDGKIINAGQTCVAQITYWFTIP
jgi:acyl-CoA reductase-like NAD-dependent aldehyde dehydrogenase